MERRKSKWSKGRIEQYNRKRKTLIDKLSKYDNIVPEDYVGIYHFFQKYVKKLPSNYTSESRYRFIQNMRNNTFKAIAVFKQRYKSPSIADLWNYNIDSFTKLGHNYFATVDSVAPIARLIQCFEKKTYGDNGKPFNAIAFGIKDVFISEYARRYRESKESGEQLVAPYIYPAQEKTREEVLFGEDVLFELGEEQVKVDIHPLYIRFCHLCDIMGISPKDAILEALSDYTDKHDDPKLHELGWYGKTTELDRALFNKEYVKGKEDTIVRLPASLISDSVAILRGYNMRNARKINFDDYIGNAVFAMNKNMFEKYGCPYIDEDEEELNESIERQGGD